VKRAIAQAQQELRERHDIEADRVLSEYASVAFSDINDYRAVFETGEVDRESLPANTAAALADLTVDTFTDVTCPLKRYQGLY